MNAHAILSARRTLLGWLCAMAASPVLAAPPEGKGRPGGGPSAGGPPGRGGPRAGAQDAGTGVAVTLAGAGIGVAAARQLVVEVRIDTGVYRPLPPGIRKKLARGKPLPPGIAKQRAPAALVARLPVHAGYEWRVIGRDLVLVAIATAIIADILFDVF